MFSDIFWSAAVCPVFDINYRKKISIPMYLAVRETDERTGGQESVLLMPLVGNSKNTFEDCNEYGVIISCI